MGAVAQRLPDGRKDLTAAQQEVCDIMADQGLNVSDAARMLGIPRSAAYARLRQALRVTGSARILELYPSLAWKFDPNHKDKPIHAELSDPDPSVKLVAPIDPENPLPAIQERLALVLDRITPSKLSAAKLSELSGMMKQLFEAAQLLQGKPTTISDRSNVAALDKLVPAVLAEAERRGLAFDQAKVVPGEVLEVQASCVPSAEVEARGDEAHPPGGLGVATIQTQEPTTFSEISEIFTTENHSQ